VLPIHFADFFLLLLSNFAFVACAFGVISQAEIWDIEAVKQQAMFYCANPDPADSYAKDKP
jgi:hypothetical protein